MAVDAAQRFEMLPKTFKKSDNCVTTDLTNVFVCHEVDQLIASMIGAHLVCQ